MAPSTAVRLQSDSVQTGNTAPCCDTPRPPAPPASFRLAPGTQPLRMHETQHDRRDAARHVRRLL